MVAAAEKSCNEKREIERRVFGKLDMRRWTTMSLGHKLTWYLLVGVLAVMGLDVYFSLKRTYHNLLIDVWREVDAISRTLRISLEKTGNDQPEQFFAQLAPEISDFENVLGVAFYDRTGTLATISSSLQGWKLPEVDVRSVIATKTATDGLYKSGAKRRYYRVEPIINSTGEGIAAFLVVEDFPFFTREFRGRMLQALLTILLLLIVLSVIVSVATRQGVTRPLRTLTSRVEEIGRGQLHQRLNLVRNDEIGRLAQEFDLMCVRLQDAHQKLIEEGEEKLRLERALRHSEKLAALGNMASRLAHEIGTPLNVIQGRAEQLLQRDSLSGKDHAFVNVIVAQIERISNFIRQLLTLAHKPEPQSRLINVNDSVRRVWAMIGEEERADGVNLSFTLAEKLSPIRGDADQLQQVVLNLVVNALQAVKTEGRVTITTREAIVQESSDHGMVEIEVCDTGPGIASQDLSRVFEPFFSTKSKEGGTGLGLAICREIILSHQGEIQVESRESGGTRVIASFPAVRATTDQQLHSGASRKEQHYGDNSA